MKSMFFRVVWAASVAAAAFGAPFHFAIVGDRTGRAVPGIYEAVWREVAASHPDMVITVGDAIEGMDDPSAPAEWEAVAHSWLRDVPVYHTPGNHDVWDTASAALFTRETGDKLFYSFDFRGAHFVVLDNSRTADLSAEQLTFLQSNLAARRGKGPAFVFFHRAYWLLPLKLRVKGFALQKIAEQYGVCCVISGHGHEFESLSENGVRYVEIGSSGASLAPAGPPGAAYADGWFYQYAFVTVDGDAVTFEIRELAPPFGQSRVIRFQAGGR